MVSEHLKFIEDFPASSISLPGEWSLSGRLHCYNNFWNRVCGFHCSYSGDQSAASRAARLADTDCAWLVLLALLKAKGFIRCRAQGSLWWEAQQKPLMWAIIVFDLLFLYFFIACIWVFCLHVSLSLNTLSKCSSYAGQKSVLKFPETGVVSCHEVYCEGNQGAMTPAQRLFSLPASMSH